MYSEIILKGKLSPPPDSPGNIFRKELVQLIENSADRGLLIISAPPGYGKTCVLSQWAYSASSRPVWINADKSDSEYRTFIQLLQKAFSEAVPEVSSMLQAVLDSGELPPAEHLGIFFSSAIEESGKKVRLVIDDYHRIDDKNIHSLIKTTAANVPQNFGLILSTRSDPPFPVGRLRTAGRLSELRASDLAFSSDEVSRFYYQACGFPASSSVLSILSGKTEGWPAGLMLFSMMIKKDSTKEECERRVGTFSGAGSFISEYIFEEIFSELSGASRDILLCCAPADMLTEELIRRLTGMQNTADEIECLVSGNLFQRLEDEYEGMFKLNPLFREFLNHRLEQKYPEKAGKLHSVTAAWYHQNGAEELALTHYLSAGDFEKAAEILSSHAASLWKSGIRDTLGEQISMLPYEKIRKFPDLLCSMAGSALRQADVLNAVKYLDDASGQSGKITDADRRERLNGRIEMLRSSAAIYQGNIDAVIRHSRNSLGLLDKNDHHWRSFVLSTQAVASIWNGNGDLVNAEHAFSLAAESAAAAGNLFNELSSKFQQAIVLRMQGRLGSAADILDAASAVCSDDGGMYGGILGNMISERALLSLEQGLDEENALRQLEQGYELTASSFLSIQRWWSLYRLACGLLFSGDHEYRKTVFTELAVLSSSSKIPPWFLEMGRGLRMKYLVLSGIHAEAERLATEGRYSADEPVSNIREAGIIGYAFLLAYSNNCKAETLLDRLLKAAEAGGRKSSAVEILMIGAYLNILNGQKDSAVLKLRKAFKTGADSGFCRSFFNFGEPLTGMAVSLVSEFGRGELRKFTEGLSGPAETLHSGRGRNLYELTSREKEVLELVGRGLSNLEIAEKMFVSLNTTKTHLKNIFAKLDVSSRLQAVTAAKNIGIL